MMENTTLINMNIPVDIKEGFKKVCRLKNSNMTIVLTDFMNRYIVEEGQKIKEDLMKIKETEEMMNKITNDRKRIKDDNDRINFFQS
jgi:hypothetical protein